MFLVNRDERVFTRKEKIDLKDVVRIDFYNRGSVAVKFGLYTILPSERHTYETGGNVTENGKAELLFENNQIGELYADIKRYAGCLDK